MKIPRFVGLITFTALPMAVNGIEIELRYDYDTSGFFNQPGAKEAMRACADFFEEILVDELDEINAATSGDNRNIWSARPWHPATGNTLEIENLVVPANTLIIYPGARDLPGTTAGFATTGTSVSGVTSFFNQVLYRGQTGASDTPSTNYGPWGGSISFDTRKFDGSARVWNFSLTETDTSKTDFVGIALHEICHILGIGNADSWLDRAGSDLLFQGATSVAANGGSAPALTSNKGHWTNSGDGPYQSTTFNSFGAPHGESQRVLMSPISINNGGGHNVLTDLDLAGLIDIGWEIKLPASGTVSVANGEVHFKVPTNTGFTYRILQGNLNSQFANLGDAIAGNGSTQTMTFPLAPSGKDFFRFAVSTDSAAARPAPRKIAKPSSGILSHEWSWQSKNCCAH